ncbi:hypothetical protein POX_c03571 [Penicillium oxalicum]|uniref:CENP-S associating centromere protein X-domain-containing protein n=1 Tax=Penicillium oxalicum (strain 114-2 / CGMCC 5302) TaxID=933388 RepID=S7Z3S3_PENO1|nr:hypothetical protein POX_c03571 [Penicillium oxalicum]EPS25170.1 hypothetical protein PDE_00101 [Penicillium oxalicum 114-2]KAI2790724.1 hypothetical protein POX_c03571 [Penicillium oxalicum]
MVDAPAQKKRQRPFKPPSRASSSAGPSASAPKPKPKPKQTNSKAATNKATSLATASNSNSHKAPTPAKRKRDDPPPSASESADGSDADSDASAHSRERSLSQEPDFILAEIITHHEKNEDVNSSDPQIPSKLLTRLLHHHFQNEKTKIAKDANTVVAKYVDVFVREAIARAAYERAGADNAATGSRIGDGFLEVEDLEKMAPQLTMDF